MTDLYEMPMPPEVARVLEEMRTKISNVMGVTLQGNRLTLRFNDEDKNLVDIHMVIIEVGTPTEAKDWLRKCDEIDAIKKKYARKCPDLAAELFHVEHGEWPD